MKIKNLLLDKCLLFILNYMHLYIEGDLKRKGERERERGLNTNKIIHWMNINHLKGKASFAGGEVAVVASAVVDHFDST